jgi:orotate phosphoribosyltransferase
VAGLRDLLAARDGHFRFESGHHGELLLDLDGLFWVPLALESPAAELAARLAAYGVQAVVGPLTGGALLAHLVAARLGVAFAAAERHAHDPAALYSAVYRLPAAVRPRLRGLRVAVVDDVVNAGSAVRSTVAAVRDAGADPVAVGALLRLGDAALRGDGVGDLPLETLDVWPHALWEPPDCPLCVRGVPLEDAGQ